MLHHRTSQWWRTHPPCPMRRCPNWSCTSQSCGKKLAGLLAFVEYCWYVLHGLRTPLRARLWSNSGDWHSSWSEPPPEFSVKCPPGTLPIWSKKFTATPSPANGGVCGVKTTTNALWQNSSGFWRSLQGRCNASVLCIFSFFPAASDKYHIVSSFKFHSYPWVGLDSVRGLEVHVSAPIV